MGRRRLKPATVDAVNGLRKTGTKQLRSQANRTQAGLQDGTSDATLTVTVEDAFGNVVADTPVTLSASGSDNTFTPISGTTNASGVFTAAADLCRSRVLGVLGRGTAVGPAARLRLRRSAAIPLETSLH